MSDLRLGVPDAPTFNRQLPLPCEHSPSGSVPAPLFPNPPFSHLLEPPFSHPPAHPSTLRPWLSRGPARRR
eukprot:371638-Rhodomonas_salina.3